ncbi:MAG: endonuclease III [Bacilli bacterium]|nr:endonuclease III [Bacilli bacterium]
MTKKERVVTFENYLEELYQDARCELNYSKDYELLIAVVLSAQTTDKRVNSVTPILFSRYPTLKELANASIDEVAQILVPIGTFQKKAQFVVEIAKHLVLKQEGKVPNDPDYLVALPGVGRKTVNVVLSNLYDYPAIAVDTHVERVSKRLGFAKKDASVLEVEEKLMKLYQKKNWSRRHHQMVLFGRYHCKAIRPECENCKIKDICSYK